MLPGTPSGAYSSEALTPPKDGDSFLLSCTGWRDV